MATLMEFLLAMGEDADLFSRFLANPEAEIQAAGLSPEERAVFHSRDPLEVHRLLGEHSESYAKPTAVYLFIWRSPSSARAAGKRKTAAAGKRKTGAAGKRKTGAGKRKTASTRRRTR